MIVSVLIILYCIGAFATQQSIQSLVSDAVEEGYELTASNIIWLSTLVVLWPGLVTYCLVGKSLE